MRVVLIYVTHNASIYLCQFDERCTVATAVYRSHETMNSDVVRIRLLQSYTQLARSVPYEDLFIIPMSSWIECMRPIYPDVMRMGFNELRCCKDKIAAVILPARQISAIWDPYS